MQFSSPLSTTQPTSDRVIERDFTLGDITGVVWSPVSGEPAPLILMGHGGGLHKRSPGLVARARYYVTSYGFRAAAIDAPGHGDRPRSEQDAQWVTAMLQARAAGQSITPIVNEYNASLAERTLPEWRATLDDLEAEYGAGPVGYTGMTLASAIGIRLMAIEPRITAAAVGGVLLDEPLLEAARNTRIPIQFLLPWDDTEISREDGFELFDAFASEEKALHANPGSHYEVPWYETEDSGRFFVRHLMH
jgi:alpha-beta hydrolase superfamily lysophospholipase